jgi:hypothetical protein
MSSSEQELRIKLNGETAKLRWAELEPHYARGALVTVVPDADLVEVAVCMARDDRPTFERWLADGTVERTSEETAQDWRDRDPVLWAVVVAPWVLVQER